MKQNYDALSKTAANYIPLTPLSFLQRTADIFPQRTAVVYGERSYTWADVNRRSIKLASALSQRGIKRGDTVTLIAANTPELFEAHFGVPMCGAVLNTVNTRLEADTIAYVLEHGDCQLLITDSAFSSSVSQALKKLDRDIPVVDIVDVQGPAGERLGEIEYESFLEEGTEKYPWKMPNDEWDALTLSYTSGTSGRPKGVVYHHRGSYLMSMGTVPAWNLSPHPTYLYTVPMFHCNGWGHAWTMALVAGTVVCCRAVTAKAIYDAVADNGVTHFGGAPIVLSMLINATDKEKREFTHAVNVITAGAPPPAAVLEQTQKLGFSVMQVYGLTETYGHVAQCLWREEWNDLEFAEKAEIQSWQGVAFPMTEQAAVIDLGNGEILPRDGTTQGEIVIRGNTVMKGYYKNPEATKDAFSDGWFHSGDAAVWREYGYIQIKDRLKDVIISGGENVSSVEVEGVLYRHPAVAAAAVIAIPSEKWGEVPCAFIELKLGNNADESELIAFCRERLAGFKTPKRVIFGELPKTATGKIQKFLLRQKVG